MEDGTRALADNIVNYEIHKLCMHGMCTYDRDDV